MKRAFSILLTILVLGGMGTSRLAVAANVNDGCDKKVAGLTSVDKKSSGQIRELFEPITSAHTGAQIFTVVRGEHPDGHKPGFYRRSLQGWDLVIPGKVMTDSRGVPFVIQLALSKNDKQNYVLTIIDGVLYLVGSHANGTGGKDSYALGTAENPLFELGSFQKRILGPVLSVDDIGVFQDETISSKGSQLIVVTVRFASPQAVGDGMTFALEVMPGAGDDSVALNGKPMVIDYTFHSMSQLRGLVGRDEANRSNLVFSEILFNQFENTDLSPFRAHLSHVEELLASYVSETLASVLSSNYFKGTGAKVAYDVTNGKILRDVVFWKMFSTALKKAIVKQTYNPVTGRNHCRVYFSNKDYDFDGGVDLLPSGAPAIWESLSGSVALISIEGQLHAIAGDINYEQYNLEVALGKTAEIFKTIGIENELPVAATLRLSVTPGSTPIESAVLILSAKGATGRGGTLAIKLNYLNQSLLQVAAEPFPILNYFISETDMQNRIGSDDQKNVIFDTVTPEVNSEAEYKQNHDEAAPYLDIRKSSAAAKAYKFKKPSRVSVIAANLGYATFAARPGIENPSGLYYGIPPEKITGNESKRIVGELLPNPGLEIVPDKAFDWRDYALAQTKFSVNFKDDQVGWEHRGPAITLYLFAVDAARKGGAAGFQFFLVAMDGQGAYRSYNVTPGAKEWVASYKTFQSAIFVRGRRDEVSSMYLLLSFKNAETKKEVTFSRAISLKPFLEPDDGLKASPLAKEALPVGDIAINPTELERSLGFDATGSPVFSLTPHLPIDDYFFSVFDFKAGTKVVPNQDGTALKRNMTFGEYKRGSTNEALYVEEKNSWSVEFLIQEILKENPDLGRSVELAQFDSFIELSDKLDAMANSRNPAKRVILVVPESLRAMVWDFILFKSLSPYLNRHPHERHKVQYGFTAYNRDLKLNFYNSKKSSQEQFFANLKAWAMAAKVLPGERSFLLARMDDLQKIKDGTPLPKEATTGFSIRDVGGKNNSDSNRSGDASVVRPPNFLYLLAAERPMPLKEFKSDSTPPSASMLILATPAEMTTLNSQAAIEVDSDLLKKFETIEIKDPDRDSMSASLGAIFQNRDVENLEYKFSAEAIQPGRNLSSQESFNTVIEYAVSRFSFLVEKKKDSKFESFMRFRSAFANSVLSDREARRTRVIDKFFIERVLTQVFDIPINIATLPDDDPLKVLSRPDALLKLQEAGYSGPFDLKAKVLNTLVSQARPDAGKPIPSSIIFFGKSGSGKTFFFESLVKLLNLKLYDFNSGSTGQDASAIMIRMADISDPSSNSTTGTGRERGMTIDAVLNHLETFLAQPNGYRGYILIDDCHAAKDSVKAKMLSFIRGLFESPGGMYTVKVGNQVIRRPVRNLNIFMTLNPTVDQEQIAKYAKDKANPTTEEILLATLSTFDFKVEPSFLKRIGRIINLDYMPAGAKGPELINKLASSSNDLLNTHNRIALVEPEVIRALVKNNETVDARSFLSAATSSLMESAANANGGSLVLVVPKTHAKISTISDSDLSAAERISKWTTEQTRVLRLDSDLEGNLAFIKMLIDAFRIPVFESFVLGVQENRRLAGDLVAQKTTLGPILAALEDHLKARSYVSVSDLPLNASDFNLRTASERDYFRAAVKRDADPNRSILFPEFFKSVESQISTWRDVVGIGSNEEANSQNAILADTMQLVSRSLHKKLSETLRLSDVDVLPTSIDGWLQRLPSGATADRKQVGRDLVGVFLNFLDRIFDRNTRDELADRPPLSIYGATRLFLYCIDRSTVQLPWVSTSHFLLRALEAITSDQVLSQNPGVQSFLFTDPERLIKPSIPDVTFQIISSSQSIEQIPKANRQRMLDDFDARYKLTPGNQEETTP